MEKMKTPLSLVTGGIGIGMIDGFLNLGLSDGFYVLIGIGLITGLIWQWRIISVSK